MSDLRGEWRLVSGHDDSAKIAAGSHYGEKTLSVDDHGVGGSDDCNSFGYSYPSADPPSIYDWTFPLDSLLSTAVGCLPAAGALSPAPSGHYSSALVDVTEATFEGDELVLRGGESELRFVAQK